MDNKADQMSPWAGSEGEIGCRGRRGNVLGHGIVIHGWVH